VIVEFIIQSKIDNLRLKMKIATLLLFLVMLVAIPGTLAFQIHQNLHSYSRRPHHAAVYRSRQTVPNVRSSSQAEGRTIKSTAKFSSPASVDEGSSTTTTTTIDTVLSNLTSGFPFFVLGAAIMGLFRPSTLLWTNRGSLITCMLASVMCATGLTLEKEDFTKVLNKDLAAVPAGVLCQFMIMPLSAFFLGRAFLLSSSGEFGPALFLGLCLVGCSPGGTASNLVS
jgi:hypothetical protein